jgi:proteic killer suppression protein
LLLQLARLDASKSAVDMNLPGWRWHSLSGKWAGRWAVWVDQNWRLTFSFEGTDAVLVDYQDYH